MLLAVDLELLGASVVWVVQDVVALGFPAKQVLLIHAVWTATHNSMSRGNRFLCGELRRPAPLPTVAAEALEHGQQAAPWLHLLLLRDRRQCDGDGVQAAQRPRAAGRLAGRGGSTGGAGARLGLRLGLGWGLCI